jgi:nucleotidyltransferase substrate binding protein (TIGR01987 family)
MKKIFSALKKETKALVEADQFFAEVAERCAADSLEYRMAASGFIQHFEFTFELARNLIQKWLRENAPRATELDPPLTRREVFRFAARHHLIDAPEAWFAFADARNLASHTYNREVAEDVCLAAKEFCIHVQFLIRKMSVDHDSA